MPGYLGGTMKYAARRLDSAGCKELANVELGNNHTAGFTDGDPRAGWSGYLNGIS